MWKNWSTCSVIQVDFRVAVLSKALWTNLQHVYRRCIPVTWLKVIKSSGALGFDWLLESWQWNRIKKRVWTVFVALHRLNGHCCATWEGRVGQTGRWHCLPRHLSSSLCSSVRHKYCSFFAEDKENGREHCCMSTESQKSFFFPPNILRGATHWVFVFFRGGGSSLWW